MNIWMQIPIPSTDQIEDFVNADQLTFWDFAWAALIIGGTFLLSRLARRLVRKILRRFPHVTDEHAFLIARASGCVVFFAGRRLMDNFSSGLVLQGTPMFAPGDQIVTESGTGTVLEITGRTVVLNTIDGQNVHIPNKMVIDSPVVNLTELGGRRSTLQVGVAYGTDLDHAKQVLEDAAKECEFAHLEPPPEALVAEFSDHSVVFQLLFWHNPFVLDQYRATDGIARSIARAFAHHGIVIAFPQRTLWWGDPDSRPKTPDL